MALLRNQAIARPLFISLFALPFLTVLVLALLNPEVCLKADSEGYLKLASNLWQHHVFSRSDVAPFVPELVRLPGYPLFLTPFTFLFSDPLRWIITAQCLMGIFAVWLCRQGLARLGGPAGMQAGMLFFAYDYVVLMHQPFLLAEALFLTAIVVAVMASLRAFSKGDASSAGVAGLLWGSTILIKPVLMFLPIFLVPFYWRNKKAFVLFFVLAYSLPLMWCARNQAVAGHFQLMSQGGTDLLQFPAASVEALRTHRDRASVYEELHAQIDADNVGLTDTAVRAELYGKAAGKILKEHPFLTIRYCINGALKIIAGTGTEMIMELAVPSFRVPQASRVYKANIEWQGTRALLHQFPFLIPLQLGVMAMLLVRYILFACGLWALWKRDQLREALFLLVGPLYILAISSHQGYYRYQIPMVPFLVCGVAAAWPFLFKRWEPQQ